MKKFLLLLLGLVLCLISIDALATTYYVTNVSSLGGRYYDDGASNGNNGTTSSTPFVTMAYAVAQLGAGDTLFIKGGLWTHPDRTAINGEEMSTPDFSIIWLDVSGTVGNEIVIKSYIGDSCTTRPEIVGQNSGGNRIYTGFASEREEYIILDSLIIHDCGKGGVLIFAVDHLTVKNCVIYDIYTLPGSYDELNTAGIYHNGQSPYNDIWRNDSCTFIHDTIYNIRNAAGNIGDHTNTNPITGRGLYRSIIRSNYLYGGYHGIRLKTMNKFNIVDSNLIFNIAQGEGIVVGEGSHKNHVMYNTIWTGTGQNGDGTGGIGLAWSYEDDVDSNYIYNNTCWGDDFVGRAGIAFGDWQESAPGNHINSNFVFNNIFYDFTTGSGNCCPAYSMYHRQSVITAPEEYIDHNCYYDPDHEDVVRNASTAYNLAEWQAFSVYDDNSRREDPQFLSLDTTSENGIPGSGAWSSGFLHLDTLNTPDSLLTGGAGANFTIPAIYDIPEGDAPTYMGAHDPYPDGPEPSPSSRDRRRRSTLLLSEVIERAVMKFHIYSNLKIEDLIENEKISNLFSNVPNSYYYAPIRDLGW